MLHHTFLAAGLHPEITLSSCTVYDQACSRTCESSRNNQACIALHRIACETCVRCGQGKASGIAGYLSKVNLSIVRFNPPHPPSLGCDLIQARSLGKPGHPKRLRDILATQRQVLKGSSDATTSYAWLASVNSTQDTHLWSL